MTHTPGPWQYRDIAMVEAEDGTVIAECVDQHNGELIAAAPLMLEALQAVRPFMIPGMNWTDSTGELIKSMVLNAIRRATS